METQTRFQEFLLFRGTFDRKISDPALKQMLSLAYLLAETAHEGQIRHDKTPYFDHPIAVALIISQELIIEEETRLAMLLATAILHDTLEQTPIELDSLPVLIPDLPPKVLRLLKWLTKPTPEQALTREQRLAPLLANTDLDLQIIKGADNLHNQRTMRNCKKKKLITNSREGLDIIIPWLEKNKHDHRIRYLISRIRRQAKYHLALAAKMT